MRAHAAVAIALVAACGRVDFDDIGTRFAGSGADFGASVATDAAGDLYVAGTFGATIDLGTGVMTTAGDDDVFVASYAPDGETRWARQFGGSASDGGQGVAIDPAGNVYVTGVFSGAVDFGSGAVVSNGPNDIFLLSLTPDGEPRWARQFGGSSTEPGREIGMAVVADADAVYLAANFFTSADFGAGPLAPGGDSDVAIASYTHDGDYRWAVAAGGASSNTVNTLALDAAGDVYAAGYFTGSFTFGGAGLTPPAGADMFVARWSGSGELAWQRAIGGPGFDQAIGVAVDPDGNVYVAGEFADAIAFGSATVTATEPVAGLAASLSADGDPRWALALNGGPCSRLRGVAASATGDVYFAGDFEGSADFGGGSALTSAGFSDIIVADVGQDGVLRWSRRFGTTADDVGAAIVAAADGAVYATGAEGGITDCHATTIEPGSEDAFLVRVR